MSLQHSEDVDNVSDGNHVTHASNIRNRPLVPLAFHPLVEGFDQSELVAILQSHPSKHKELANPYTCLSNAVAEIRQ